MSEIKFPKDEKGVEYYDPAGPASREIIPNPGSKEALDQGCTCPVLDNCFGAGVCEDENGKTLFWFNQECPIHGHLLTDKVVKNGE